MGVLTRVLLSDVVAIAFRTRLRKIQNHGLLDHFSSRPPRPFRALCVDTPPTSPTAVPYGRRINVSTRPQPNYGCTVDLVLIHTCDVPAFNAFSLEFSEKMVQSQEAGSER